MEEKMNKVYRAPQFNLPTAKFATVKQGQRDLLW
jgi:hypothetical protein